MKLEFEGSCRRIDLALRAKYPYLRTKIYKVRDYNYVIFIENTFDDFHQISKDFNHSIRFVGTPVNLSEVEPQEFDKQIPVIRDESIPSKFEGLPFTIYDLSNHVECIHKGLVVTRVIEDHDEKKIYIEIQGEISEGKKINVQSTLDDLKGPYKFKVIDRGDKKDIKTPSKIVFNIASATSQKRLNAPYLDRDEELWFKNVEDIYSGVLKKDDLFFFDSANSSCLVNFSIFQNSNIRNHLLLYDVVYCILPLRENMGPFLEDQKLTREDILSLVDKGRLKIINTQPESRLDLGFINEVYQTDPTSVVSRRALAALCAIDLVDINSSYILNDPEFQKIVIPILKEIADSFDFDFHSLTNYMFWPQKALRKSFDSLNFSGSKGIATYGINKSITDSFTKNVRKELEFEFSVNSESIHIAHALDATYFPFICHGSKYTDHPYAMMMGNLLNFYKTANIEHLREAFHDICEKEDGNPSIKLISIFDVNDYISISEFERAISSSVLRKGLKSLFNELSKLEIEERNKRISEYNSEITIALSRKKYVKHALDLGEDIAGIFVPLISTGKKFGSFIKSYSKKKNRRIRDMAEYLEYKLLSSIESKKRISLLTKINRVARLRKHYDNVN